MLEGKLGRGIVNKHILKFPEEGLKQLQFFMEGLSFPVAVAAYTEQDIVKISYLVRLKNPVRTYDYLRLQRLLKKCREQTLGKSR